MSETTSNKENIVDTLERQFSSDEGGVIFINSPEEGQIVVGKLLPGRRLFVITPTEIIMTSSATDGLFHRIPLQKEPVWKKKGGEGI